MRPRVELKPWDDIVADEILKDCLVLLASEKEKQVEGGGASEGDAALMAWDLRHTFKDGRKSGKFKNGVALILGAESCGPDPPEGLKKRLRTVTIPIAPHRKHVGGGSLNVAHAGGILMQEVA